MKINKQKSIKERTSNKKTQKSVKKQQTVTPKVKPKKATATSVIKQEKNKDKTLKIRFLGGVGEIGKNMTAIEYGKDIIIIDAGLTFPGDDMPGVDLVIPDVNYLAQNKNKIRGMVITHGHEDHIGAIPYILKDVNVPIYGTKLTLTLIENKIREHKINDAVLNCVNAGSVIKLGCFSVEFVNVNHSIAGACALSTTMAPVPSGELSSTMSTSNWCST